MARSAPTEAGSFFRVVSREPLDGSAGQSDSVYFPFCSGTESHVTRFVLTLAELSESFFLKVVCESIEKVCERVGTYTWTSFLLFLFPLLNTTRCLLQNETGCWSGLASPQSG